jgi:hypothetical protein
MPANVFAICLKARRGRVDSVLMIVDEKDEAEEIAFELRRKGHEVEVREYRPRDDPDAES